MLSNLIIDLLSKGFSEADVGKRIGLNQASINRIKLGKQKEPGFAAVDALRLMHREHCPEKYPRERVA